MPVKIFPERDGDAPRSGDHGVASPRAPSPSAAGAGRRGSLFPSVADAEAAVDVQVVIEDGCKDEHALLPDNKDGSFRPPSAPTRSDFGDTGRTNPFCAAARSSVSDVMLKKGVLRRPRLGIHEAIQRGQLKVVAQVCSERIGTVAIDESGLTGSSSGWNETPLMVACQAYHLPLHVQLELIESLLGAGARMDIVDGEGRSPLALAVLAAPWCDVGLASESPHWMERGDACLVRDRGDRRTWKEGSIISCYTSSLSNGGVTTYDVKVPNNILRGVLPVDVCSAKVKKHKVRKMTLGMSVLYKAHKTWVSGVITAINPRGGYDVQPVEAPLVDGFEPDDDATSVRSGDWSALRCATPAWDCERPPSSVPEQQRSLPRKGLRRTELRFPLETASKLKEATEGQLFPGAPVQVFLPNWSKFRSGMIQGRNTLQGGFNVLLREEVDPATGNLLDARHQWLHYLQQCNKSQHEGQRHLPYLARLGMLKANKERAMKGTRLLVGVHLEWICISRRNAKGISTRGRVGLVQEKLCQERRLGMRGLFIPREQFDTDERWQKQENTQRRVHQGQVSGASPLSGSQVVALATRQNSVEALQKLWDIRILRNKRDLVDWVDGKSAVNMIVDPHVLLFFLKLGAGYKLARAVRLSGSVQHSSTWLVVVRTLLRRKDQDPFFWTASSPKGTGLNAVGWACTYGRLDILDLLLQHNEAVSIATQPHRSSQDPLYLTTMAKVQEPVKLEMLKHLVSVGVSVVGSRALVAAVEEGYLLLMEFLLEFGADPTMQVNGVRPQEVARSFGAVEFLLQHSTLHGRDLTILPVRIVCSALQYPAGSRDREGWLKILEHVRGDWNAWSADGHTALSAAVQGENLELVKLLLMPGRCNPNIRTADGEYPIGLACKSNTHADIAAVLLDHGAESTNDNDRVFLRGTLALPRVCVRGHKELFDVLLAHHKRPQNREGRNGLDFKECHYSHKGGSLSLIELLLNHRDVDDDSRTIRSMVMRLAELNVPVKPALIAKHGWLDVLQEVLSRDGVVRAPIPTPGQVSALMHAIAKGDREMVQFLVEAGADLMQTDNEGRGVLVLALEAPLANYPELETEEEKNKVRYEVLRELLQRSDALSMIRASGVLAAAAKRNHLDAVDLLNDHVSEWCEEDEMIICPDTKMRLSPVSLASDQRVQRKLIMCNAFYPNVADLAQQGKFRLAIRVLEQFREEEEEGTANARRRFTKISWAMLATQKSTGYVPAGMPCKEPEHTARTTLGWILPERFISLEDLAGDFQGRGEMSWLCVPERVREAWGVRTRDSYLCGTAKAVADEEGGRLDPDDHDFTGMVEWTPHGLDHVGPLILPIHQLLFKRPYDMATIARGSTVLVRRDQVGVRNRGHTPGQPQATMTQQSTVFSYQRVYVVDEYADTLGSEDNGDDDDNICMITASRGYLVTTEEPRKHAGSGFKIKQPFKVATSECFPIGRVSDMSNEDAATQVIALFDSAGVPSIRESTFRDEHGVSLLELAAQGGDLKLVKLVLRVYSQMIDDPDLSPVRARDQTPLGRAVEGLTNAKASALCAAVAARQYEVVEYFLRKGLADAADMKQGKSAGTWAASECVMQLLRSKWKPQHGALYGDHLYDLALCARRGWVVEVDELLTKYKADINKEDARLSTPLMESSRGGHVELFSLLLRRGAVVDKFNDRGQSVLTILVSLGSDDLRGPAYAMVLELLSAPHVTYSSSSYRFNQTMLQATMTETVATSPLSYDDDKDPPTPSEESGVAFLKQSFIRRSKALTVAVGAQNPDLKMIELLLMHGSEPDESNAGKTAVRHLGSTSFSDLSPQCLANQRGAAGLVLRRLLSWRVEVVAMNHLYKKEGDVVATDGGFLKVRFEVASLDKDDPTKEITEVLSCSEVRTTYKGPAAGGMMSHLDFMHIVSMGWPDVVELMVDLGTIEGYYLRTLPYICNDSLKEALLQCIDVLGPIWRDQQASMESDITSELIPNLAEPPAEWYVLRQLLRALNQAHEDESCGPSLQQAVNELLAEEKETLGLIPLSLYKEAILMSKHDKTFFSELFILQQHKLMREMCEQKGHTLLTGMRLPCRDDAEDFEIFKKLFKHGKEFEGAGGTLEIAAEYGWVEAVRWLISQNVSANDTNTANKPIRTVALEVSEQCQDITGHFLERFMNTCGELTGAQYVEFMRDRDVHGVRYFYKNSLNDTILKGCAVSPMTRSLVELAMLLFANGADADPDDFERLSQVMRLDQRFDAKLIHGATGAVSQAHQVSLLHVASSCDNVTAVAWLLDNDAYRDTVGSGIMEDKVGRTARSYTGSHACHQVLAKKEEEKHHLQGYMPPQDQIDLVIALKTDDDFNIDWLMNIAKVFTPPATPAIGVSPVVYVLNCLDLGGFVLRYQEEVYVVVSGTEKRQNTTTDRHPHIRFAEKHLPLLSKEKHCITARVANSFTWPILDLKLQTAVHHLEKSLATFESDDAELERWVREKQWYNYGHEVNYPVSIKVWCRNLEYSGDYHVNAGSSSSSPVWEHSEGERIVKEDADGCWCLYDMRYDTEHAMFRAATPAKGRAPSERFHWEWRHGETWKPDYKVFITEMDERRTPNSWNVVDNCQDVVFALLTDRNPPSRGKNALDMTRRMIHVVSSLRDGSPSRILIKAPAFHEIDGVYERDDDIHDSLGWSWTNEKGFQLTASFSRMHSADSEESVGVTYAKKDAPNPGVVSLFTISHCKYNGEHKDFLEMRSNDVPPWSDESVKWVNATTKTPAPSIICEGLDSRMDPLDARMLLERKTRAMWSLRQILLASSMPRDNLPYRSVGRLEPDVPCVYVSPNLDNEGNLPPGQNFLDLLRQENRIAQVFGVHNEAEAQDVLEEWQPDVFKLGFRCLLMPWLWQPFCSITEFLFENPERDLEKRYDPLTKMVCDRKTYLNLEPIEHHTSEHWDRLERLHIAARDVPLFKEREPKYYSPQEGFDLKPTTTLKKFTGVIVKSRLRDWLYVAKENDEWWLQVFDKDGNELLRKMTSTTESNSECVYKAMFDLSYYSDTVTGNREVDVSVDKLLTDSEIEVMYLDLEGSWARVRHHARAVYFQDYWMPLRTPDRRHKTLRPFYLAQLTKLEAYLGSKIAFYFAFLSTYCAYLVLLLMSGLCFTAMQWRYGLYKSERVLIWNAIVVLFWAAYFRQKWISKASELAYIWNVRNVEQWEPAMAEFLKNNIKLEKRPHPITGLSEPYFTDAHRRPRYLLSILVTATMAVVVILVMTLNADLRDSYSKTAPDLKVVFGVENAFTIAVMDALYAVVAEWLNSFENHRTKSSKQNSAILKNFVFRFINGFSGLMITVVKDPSFICDCYEDCHTVCRVTRPPTAAVGTAIGACWSHEQIARCTSEYRQRDLMVQLTAQLIIQSLLSLMVEKVIPKFVLSQRQKRKKEASKNENGFPQQLGCLALDVVTESNLHELISFNEGKYFIKCDGQWGNLRSKQYGGLWMLQPEDGRPESSQVFEIRQEDGILYCSMREDGSTSTLVARRDEDPHQSLPHDADHDPHTPKDGGGPPRQRRRASILDTDEGKGVMELAFPLPTVSSGASHTEMRGFWTFIKATSSYDKLLVSCDQEGAVYTNLVRMQEAVQGTISPQSAVTLSREDRRV